MNTFAPAEDMDDWVRLPSDSSEDSCGKLQICVMITDKSIIKLNPREDISVISPCVGGVLLENSVG